MAERILLVRMSSLGDVIHATPVARALKRALPDCHLTWLAFARMTAPLQGNPHLDEIITVPDRPGLSDLLHLWWRLKAAQFTIAIDFEGILRGAAAAYTSGAFRRIGKRRTLLEAQFAYNELVPELERCAYISQQYLQVCASLGADVGDYLPEVFLSPQELREAEELLQRHGLRGSGPTIALVIFSTDYRRRWPDEHVIQLGEALAQRVGARLFIPGSAAERPQAEALAARMSPRPVVLAGETTFRQAMALLAHSDLVVGVDSGLTHAAFALGTPLVCLLGRTPLSYGPVGPRARTVFVPELTCRPCRRGHRCPHPRCMTSLTPALVLPHALDLLAASRGSDA